SPAPPMPSCGSYSLRAPVTYSGAERASIPGRMAHGSAAFKPPKTRRKTGGIRGKLGCSYRASTERCRPQACGRSWEPRNRQVAESGVTAFATDLEAAIPALRRYARALARDAEIADDLVQDTLVRALRSR